MWPFTRKPTDRELNQEALDRVGALEKRIDALEVEWEDWFGKYKRLYAQISRRAKLEEEREGKAGDAATPGAARSPLARTGNPLALALLNPPRPNGGP
jgi:hypothetical protein